MASAAFVSSLPFVLRWEGGFVDHPNDPGGRTNKGITQAVYKAWRISEGLSPDADVKTITDAEVDAIYEINYWLRARCDVLIDPFTLVQFDTAVNMGVGRAVRLLQGAVRCGVDGAFGSGTLKAVQTCDRDAAVVRYCDAREQFYRRLAEQKPDLAVFLKGWLNRLDALRKEIGLPGYESAVSCIDFGNADYIRKIPDIGEDSSFGL